VYLKKFREVIGPANHWHIEEVAREIERKVLLGGEHRCTKQNQKWKGMLALYFAQQELLHGNGYANEPLE